LVRDTNGERFVDELLPRDEVSRAMTRRMLELGVDHCWLDATGLEQFDARFPTISVALGEAGLDPGRDWLPIAPAAHYLSGGVVTDLDGATSLPHLWAAGEVACSGVHGANRLASNSLLEGMVFGFRVVEAIDRGIGKPAATGAMRSVFAAEAAAGGRPGTVDPSEIGGLRLTRTPVTFGGGTGSRLDAAAARDQLQRAMTSGAGVLRSAGSLDETAAIVADLAARIDDGAEPQQAELRNLIEVAHGTLCAATRREESRGAHTRTDHPDQDPALRLRMILGS
jgi:L-aspartate oxidase